MCVVFVDVFVEMCFVFDKVSLSMSLSRCLCVRGVLLMSLCERCLLRRVLFLTRCLCVRCLC